MPAPRRFEAAALGAWAEEAEAEAEAEAAAQDAERRALRGGAARPRAADRARATPVTPTPADGGARVRGAPAALLAASASAVALLLLAAALWLLGGGRGSASADAGASMGDAGGGGALDFEPLVAGGGGGGAARGVLRSDAPTAAPDPGAEAHPKPNTQPKPEPKPKAAAGLADPATTSVRDATEMFGVTLETAQLVEPDAALPANTLAAALFYCRKAALLNEEAEKQEALEIESLRKRCTAAQRAPHDGAAPGPSEPSSEQQQEQQADPVEAGGGGGGGRPPPANGTAQAFSADPARVANASLAAWPETDFLCTGEWRRVAPSPDAGHLGGLRLGGLNATAFLVWMCVNGPERLTGAIRIHKRVDCASASREERERGGWTRDAAWRRDVEARFGSEEFFLTLEGPEMFGLAREVRHFGNCRYEAPFRVRVSGKYRLGLMWTRDSYRAADDTFPGFPEMYGTYPVGKAVYVELGQRDRALEQWIRVVNGSGLVDCGSRTKAMLRSGSWVLRDGPEARFAEVYVRPRAAELRRFVDPNAYVWLPRSCRLPTWSQLADRCYRRTDGMLILGDSHASRQYDTYTQGLCAWDKPVVRQQDNVDRTFNFTACNRSSAAGLPAMSSFKGARIEFVKEHLDKGAIRSPNRNKMLLISFGQWIMNRPAHWNDELGRSLKVLVELLLREYEPGISFVWLGTPISPARWEWWVRGTKDGRTLVRVLMQAIRYEAGLESVFGDWAGFAPLFDMTLPWHSAFEDFAHFSNELYMNNARVALALACP